MTNNETVAERSINMSSMAPYLLPILIIKFGTTLIVMSSCHAINLVKDVRDDIGGEENAVVSGAVGEGDYEAQNTNVTDYVRDVPENLGWQSFFLGDFKFLLNLLLLFFLHF